MGIHIKIDALLNGRGEITGIVASNICKAAECAFSEIRAFYSTPQGEKADFVLANNYFKPSEAKLDISKNGIPFSAKENGTLIIAANSPQGTAPHYLFGQWGDEPEKN